MATVSVKGLTDGPLQLSWLSDLLSLLFTF